MKKIKGILIGIGLIILGIFLLVYGFLNFISITEKTQDNSFFVKKVIIGIALSFIGALCIFAGSLILYLIHVKKIFFSEEQEPTEKKQTLETSIKETKKDLKNKIKINPNP